MTRRRFYVPRDLITDGTAFLPEEQAHHLRNVLRLDADDIVEIVDGEGAGYIGQVEFQGARVLVRCLEQIPSNETSSNLILAAALIKPAKFELILQKATELGIAGIIPLQTRLSDIRIADFKIESRMIRWRRILQEAAKQCRRLSIPQLWEPLDFSSFLEMKEFSAYSKLLFYEKAQTPWRFPSDPPSRIVLCVGPEGGWDKEEIGQAKDAGVEILSLGPWTLRAETAAIAAVSIMQHQINLRNRRE
jgi:16S rRNA (uracil1498-N3)-methyltransferase